MKALIIKKNLIFKANCLEISYNEENKLIETRWLNFACGDEYRAGMAAYLDALSNYEVKRWLGDYRLAREVRIEDEKWTSEVWTPMFMPLTSKIEKLGRVNSIDIFSELSWGKMKDKLDLSKLPFEFREFTDYEKAIDWVLN